MPENQLYNPAEIGENISKFNYCISSNSREIVRDHIPLDSKKFIEFEETFEDLLSHSISEDDEFTCSFSAIGEQEKIQITIFFSSDSWYDFYAITDRREERLSQAISKIATQNISSILLDNNIPIYMISYSGQSYIPFHERRKIGMKIRNVVSKRIQVETTRCD
jgi:hypothetical protein